MQQSLQEPKQFTIDRKSNYKNDVSQYFTGLRFKHGKEYYREYKNFTT